MRITQSIIDMCRSTRVIVRPANGVLAALVMVAACTVPVDESGDESGERTGEAESAVLMGSNFEGSDGNLVVNTSGNTDWANVAGRNTGTDLPSGTTDNAFGQGTKEDDPNVKVVSGSIPPNKNDLTRFYEASELASNGHIYLYLAWERLVNTGAANLDFEINQNPTPGFTGTTTGPLTLNRTAGDLLVTYDFSGSGTLTLGLNTWLTAAAGNTVSQCFSANALPCWGKHTQLNGTNSEGAVNTITVAEPLAGGTLTAGLFGEAAIDLTAAGVFPPGMCEAFGSAFVKSRSSSSFTAEVKDFIAPIPVSISNCGTINIHKVTENGNGSFGFTTTGGLSPSTFSLMNGDTRTYSNLMPGSYSVTEGSLPTGWMLESLMCTSTGTGTSTSTSGATASITMGAGGNVDCTYTNHINASPTISTLLSATTVNIGDSVHDSATLTGATATAGGMVTYTVYTDNACSLGAQSAGTKTVTNGVVPDSDPITFTSPGTYFWQAAYSGDADNNAATSPCLSEQLIVKTNPSIETMLSVMSGPVGAMVSDSAIIKNATSDASGTVTYTVYTDSACSLGAQDAGTKTVTNGVVPNSNTITFNSAGTFYWQAVYSGDAKNNPATSPCQDEQLVINPNMTSITTNQSLIPNDSATLSGLTANAGGTLTFSLFSPSNAMCTGTPALTQTVNVAGNGTYNTTNTTFIASDVGTWRWLVVYSGDANNVGTTSACGVESFTITQ